MNIKTTTTGLEIAVIGISGRFPGAVDVKEFWQNLISGSDTIDVLSNEELRAAGVDEELLQQPNFVKAKGIFPELEFFDAEFFDYTPRDAETIDPQVRALHQGVYHALEDAGYPADGRKRNIGLFAGASGNFNWELATLLKASSGSASQFAAIQLNDKDFSATRLAYKLNLCGPSVTVHSACSTSLYAIDLACRNLYTGACSMAVAACSGLTLPHRNGYLYEDGMIKSPDGKCRPFSIEANGTVEGNGMGVVVLRPLADAMKAGDRIYAVIRGTAANNDGNRKVGYSAPSVEGQAEVIRRAIFMAEVEPESITYIEAHGTGTNLGDPVEIESLRKAFNTDKRNFCGIGSLKSNIGHLDTAAGISSFIKTVLALKHRELPPTVNFTAANPEINFEQSPFHVITERQEWQRPVHPEDADACLPLRAGVSSFGIGGTNVHVILEEAPPVTVSSPGSGWNTLCLSAKNETALARAVQQLDKYISLNRDINPADLAYTYQVGRGQFSHRKTWAYKTLDDLRVQLTQEIEQSRIAKSPLRVAFLFPGQGTQYPAMAAGLYQQISQFRIELEKCLSLCEQLDEAHIRRLLLDPRDGDDQVIRATSSAQLSLFVIEYALAKTLMAWGIKPYAMLGHSLGEYVAACIAGVFTLDDALKLVSQRGKLMQAMEPGAMLAVHLSEQQLREWMPVGLDIAAVNGPEQCTVAGSLVMIDAFAASLQKQNIVAKPLQTSHAFHSAMMEPMLNDYERVLGEIEFRRPQLPYLSNVTGTWITDAQAMDRRYYLDHIRQAVRFVDGITQLAVEENVLFIELGAGGVLTAFAKQQSQARTIPSISLVRHIKKDIDDAHFFAQAIGDLWAHGATLDWRKFYNMQQRQLLDVPLYPFAKTPLVINYGDIYSLLKGFSIPANVISDSHKATHPQYFSWQDALINKSADSDVVVPCLIFNNGKGKQKIFSLIGGLRPILIGNSEKYTQIASNSYAIDIGAGADYRRLIRDLTHQDGVPQLLLWHCNLIAKTDIPTLRLQINSALDAFSDECTHQHFRAVLVFNTREMPSEKDSFHWELWVRTLMLAYSNIQVSVIFQVGKLKKQVSDRLLEQEIYFSGVKENLVLLKDNRRYVYQPLSSSYAPAAELQAVGKSYAVLAPRGYPISAFVESLQKTSGAYVDSYPITLPIDFSRKSNIQNHIQLIDSDIVQTQSVYLNQYGIQDTSASHHLMDELCARLVAEYIDRFLPLEPGTVFNRSDLTQALQVIPKLEKYIDYFLQILLADNILDVTPGSLEHFNVRKSLTELRKADVIRDELSCNTFFSGQMKLLEHCVASFDQALSGTVPAIEVLYPEGSNSLLKSTYENSIQEQEDEFIRMLFEKIIVKITHQVKKIRILEAGGGYGLMMRRIMPLLKKMKNVEYYFTDIGTTFLEQAKDYALDNQCDFMTFGLFDINKPAQDQGLEENSFDIVFAFNVVHATHSIGTSIGNLKDLLVDNGILCLLERTNIRRYVDLIWGLADGWWHFDNTERQLSPLMPIEKWETLLKEKGFKSILAYPDTPELRGRLDVGVILAQNQLSIQTENTLPLIAQDKLESKAYDQTFIIDLPFSRLNNRFKSIAGNGAKINFGQKYFESVRQVLNSLKTGSPVILTQASASADFEYDPVQLAARIEFEKKTNAVSLYLPFDKTIEGYSRTIPGRQIFAQVIAVINSGWNHGVIEANHQSLFSLPAKLSLLNRDSNTNDAITFNVEATDSYEILLINIWSDLFGIENLTANDDFFELGGDSLKVAQLTTELAKHGLKVSPNEVFNNTRISQLANYLAIHCKATNENIITRDDLVQYFSLKHGVSADFVSYQVAGKRQNILFLDDLALQASGGYIQELAALNIAVDIQPDYVYPLSRIINVPLSMDSELFSNSFALQPVNEDQCQKIAHMVGHQQRRLSLQIIRGEIEERYNLSPFQKMYLKSTARVSLYEIEFEEMIDRQLLNRAFSDVIATQGLLRSSLSRSFNRLCWAQHKPADELTLPYLDLSPYSLEGKKNIVEYLMKQQYAVNFDAEKGVMFRVILIRLDLRRSTLLFNLDHSIFDNMSGQVLKRQLLNRYRALVAGTTAKPVPAKSFNEYLTQINRGPQGISPEWLIKLFDLEAYGKARLKVEERIIANRQPGFSKLRYEIDLSHYQLATDDQIAWEVSVSVIAHTLARYLQQQDIPLKLLYQGRKYQDISFFDTLGLFVDVIPLLIRTRENGQSTDIISDISRKFNLINRYNVNFMNMMLNIGMLVKWRDVLGYIAPKKLSKQDPMILLNYVGKAGDEYKNILDLSINSMLESDGKLDYASFYIIATQIDGKVVLDILCNFEKDMEVIRKIMKEETDRLLGSNEINYLLKA
jgi:acyl transferase domain-containing protein/acyl carrier protein